MAAPQPRTPLFPDHAVAITKSDTVTFPPSAIYVGTGGAVTIKPASGQAAVTFPGIPNGGMVPCMAVAVMATGTDASNLVRVS